MLRGQCGSPSTAERGLCNRLRLTVPLWAPPVPVRVLPVPVRGSPAPCTGQRGNRSGASLCERPVPGWRDGHHRAAPGPGASPHPSASPPVPAGPWRGGRTAPDAPVAGSSACCGRPAAAGLKHRGAWPRPPPRRRGGAGGGRRGWPEPSPPARSAAASGPARRGSARLRPARRGGGGASAPPQLGEAGGGRPVRPHRISPHPTRPGGKTHPGVPPPGSPHRPGVPGWGFMEMLIPPSAHSSLGFI